MRTALISLATLAALAAPAQAADAPSVGSSAPAIQLQTDKGTPFRLEDRKGHWTVLYFYPKDDTPGCTKQACAFRDAIAAIRKLDAEVYGISQDSVESHRKFIAKHGLNFPLLADESGKVSKAYGTDRIGGFSKRWTFLIDPQLKVRWVQTNVDPAMNAKEVAAELARLQAAK